MAGERTCVLSVAGFDPSGGAGILADIKTFEANKVCGMGAVTALTFQNDIEFEALKWLDADEILKQISVLQKRFYFSFVKIGLIRDLETLEAVVNILHATTPDVCMVWDPIIKASAGFEFHTKIDKSNLYSVLRKIYLITPNTTEAKFLIGKDDEMQAAKEMSPYCNVLLKGGHSEAAQGVDFLFTENNVVKIDRIGMQVFPKHGSGCVLSSAITAELARGSDLVNSCTNGKKYVEKFLASDLSLMGTHDV
jgi:hydroxymethylpyrimidine/phosphomethylpyrimidine kinase